ncbi:MAG: hypothetical protein Q8T09_02860 [Candidatus Melainabacteria bacterium]|nr:hypothetical protein [Candidatus Melainabacteria bacterium]
MYIEIILQHGWGYDRTFFSNWVEALEKQPWPRDYRIKTTLPDRGYFGAPVALDDMEYIDLNKRNSKTIGSDKLLIVVAHSLGLHLLPVEVIARADYLVTVCSFLNFHKEAPGGERRSRLLVGRMLTRLKRAPLEVLSDFYKITDPAKRFHFSLLDISVERLAADLHLLDQIDTSEDSQLSKLKSKAIVVHGLEDTLISEQQSLSLARLLNAETLICRAGHDLPLSHTNACIDLITKVILASNEARSEYCA